MADKKMMDFVMDFVEVLIFSPVIITVIFMEKLMKKRIKEKK
jgi:lipopolysaccharide/colanic/teichoic acid biosynthesis glycosyltransferase